MGENQRRRVFKEFVTTRGSKPGSTRKEKSDIPERSSRVYEDTENDSRYTSTEDL